MIAAHQTLPTGANLDIEGDTRHGFARATITEVGAGLRALTFKDVDVVQRYPLLSSPPLGAGLVMSPWPNRVRDGKWYHHGHVEQLAITEPSHGNAIHGLLFNQPYRIGERSTSSVTLHANIYPQPGYPFVVGTSVTYTIEHDGLTVRHDFVNLGDDDAPVAVGSHGYFKIGTTPTRELTLTTAATSIFDNDDRYLPTKKRPVGPRDDLRLPRRVGELVLDHCYTDIELVGGRRITTIQSEDGQAVHVWMDANFGHMVILTTDSFIDESGNRTAALALEPQTASIDALNTSDGLRWLKPSDSWSASWGVTARL